MINKRILILGAGKSERIEGATHVDQFPFEGIDIVADLNKEWFPVTEGYDLIIAKHLVEHLDNLFYFMNCCWMILKPDGILEIETPNAGINFDLTHSDPTHVRCFRPHSFINYFTPEGIEKFGYTDKPWKLDVSTFQLEVPHDCIRVIATPIK